MKNIILAVAALAACAGNPPKAEAPKPAPAPAPAPAPEKPPPPPSTPDAEYRAGPPAPGEPVVFHAPEAKALKLKNGLPVYLVERHELPLVAVDLVFKSGA